MTKHCQIYNNASYSNDNIVKPYKYARGIQNDVNISREYLVTDTPKPCGQGLERVNLGVKY